MLIRFFLALLALLTGITSAQSAVPVSSAQSEIGVSSPVEFTGSNFVAQRSDVRYSGRYSSRILKRFSRDNIAVPTLAFANVTNATTTFIGDRQRT